MTDPARELELGELNVRHLSRRLSNVELASHEANKKLDLQATAISNIADDVGAIKAHLLPDPMPGTPPYMAPERPAAAAPRLSWRLFALAFASSAISLIGAHFLSRIWS